MVKTPTLLIDASIYIFQYYFSLPDHWAHQKKHWSTAAVYGYTAFLSRLLIEQRPERIAACFDESLGSCFRNDIYPDYKLSRAFPDEALAFQLQACRQVSDLLGIKTFASDYYEADDLIGSLSQRLYRSSRSIAILTRDKDLGQLLTREGDCLWDYAANQQYFSHDIEQKFGVGPGQLVDYLALVGDTIDDIPGVPGVGQKTAQHLLKRCGSLELLWDQLDQVANLPIRGAKQLPAKLLEYREQIEMAQQLATIVRDIDLIASVNALRRTEPDWFALEQFCHEMGFPKLFQRIKNIKTA